MRSACPRKPGQRAFHGQFLVAQEHRSHGAWEIGLHVARVSTKFEASMTATAVTQQINSGVTFLAVRTNAMSALCCFANLGSNGLRPIRNLTGIEGATCRPHEFVLFVPSFDGTRRRLPPTHLDGTGRPRLAQSQSQFRSRSSHLASTAKLWIVCPSGTRASPAPVLALQAARRPGGSSQVARHPEAPATRLAGPRDRPWHDAPWRARSVSHK